MYRTQYRNRIRQLFNKKTTNTCIRLIYSNNKKNKRIGLKHRIPQKTRTHVLDFNKNICTRLCYSNERKNKCIVLKYRIPQNKCIILKHRIPQKTRTHVLDFNKNICTRLCYSMNNNKNLKNAPCTIKQSFIL